MHSAIQSGASLQIKFRNLLDVFQKSKERALYHILTIPVIYCRKFGLSDMSDICPVWDSIHTPDVAVR